MPNPSPTGLARLLGPTVAAFRGAPMTSVMAGAVPAVTRLLTDDPTANAAAGLAGAGLSLTPAIAAAMSSGTAGLAGLGASAAAGGAGALVAIPGLIGALTQALDAPSSRWRSFPRRLVGTTRGTWDAGNLLANQFLTSTPDQSDALIQQWRQGVEGAGVGGFGSGTGFDVPPGGGMLGVHEAADHDLPQRVTFEPQVRALQAMADRARAGATSEDRARTFNDTLSHWSSLATLQDTAAGPYGGYGAVIEPWAGTSGPTNPYGLADIERQVQEKFGGDVEAAGKGLGEFLDEQKWQNRLWEANQGLTNESADEIGLARLVNDDENATRRRRPEDEERLG